jgi:hypothetical protein
MRKNRFAPEADKIWFFFDEGWIRNPSIGEEVVFVMKPEGIIPSSIPRKRIKSGNVKNH